MISSKSILCVFLCICCSQAYPTDSADGHKLVSEISQSLQQAFSEVGGPITELRNNQQFQTKCLEGLGCFYDGPPFYHPYLRPASLLPFDLEDMHTKFYLYTSRSERTLLEPNKESLAKSPYDKSLGLQIFIHGYQMKFTPTMRIAIEEVIETIMEADRQNIIIVDWTASNQKPYAQAVANGRVVGAQVAQLVKFLQDAADLDPKNVYIFGHSLGSHVCGWAGKRIPNLGRITGLDPAGPYFQFGVPEIRLHHTDATFVDVIHTDIADYYVHGLGIVEPIGDLDFYPNGGSNQPGCEKTFINMTRGEANTTIENNKKAYFDDPMSVRCNHVRALVYFLESARNKKCKFIGLECTSYGEFERGNCRLNAKAEMGFFAKKDPKFSPESQFYLDTSDKEPYCIQK